MRENQQLDRPSPRLARAFPALSFLNIACLLTLCGGMCGIGGIVSLLRADTARHYALYQCAAYVCDAMDGTVARKLSRTSPFGKALDSLCDCISFAALPGVALMTFGRFHPLYIAAGLLYAACGILRLTYFDIVESDGTFIGVSSPVASGLLILPRFLAALFCRGAAPAALGLVYPVYGIAVALLMVAGFRTKKYGPFNLGVAVLGLVAMFACLALGRCPIL